MFVYIAKTCIGKLSVEEEKQLDLVGIRTKAKDEAQVSLTSRRRWGMAVLTDPGVLRHLCTRLYRSVWEVVQQEPGYCGP